MQQIVSLVGHQELRAVGRAQNQRTSRAQPRHHHRILARHIALVEQAADLALHPPRRNRGLYRDGQPEQRSARALPLPRVVLARPFAHALRIEVGKDIQLRIQPFDLRDVRLGKLGHREFAGAQKLQLSRGRVKHQILHGCATGVAVGGRSSVGVEGIAL